MNFGSLDWRWGRASKGSLDANSLNPNVSDPNVLDERLHCTVYLYIYIQYQLSIAETGHLYRVQGEFYLIYPSKTCLST